MAFLAFFWINLCEESFVCSSYFSSITNYGKMVKIGFETTPLRGLKTNPLRGLKTTTLRGLKSNP